MAVRAPSQVRIETLVARGRLTLAFFVLLAIYLRLPGLPGTPALTTFALGFLVYACVLAGIGLRIQVRAEAFDTGSLSP